MTDQTIKVGRVDSNAFLWRHNAVRCAIVFLMLAFAPVLAFAQAGTTASINGIVHDPTGALVPNANVQLTNQANGLITRTKSNSTGLFVFSSVQSGDYQITVTMSGFKTFVVSDIHLDPGDSRQVSEISLSPGATTEEVTVSATTGGVQLDSGEVSSTIDSEQLGDLLLQGRDATELMKILPGMAISNGSLYTVSTNTAVDTSQVSIGSGLGNYVPSGLYKNGSSLLLDGADITNPASWGSSLQTVNAEMVAQVKVTTGSFGADQAKGPVVVNSIGKSGTDHYHGSLYVSGRSYQTNSVDDLIKAYHLTPPHDYQLYPGFSFGGPVRLPYSDWNHNTKLTFFVGAEAYQQRNVYAYGNINAAIVSALVPTANMRKGIFSQSEIKSYLGDQYQTSVVNGVTTCTGNYANLCAVPSINPSGGAVAGGDISAYLDPLSAKIMSIMPLPNMPSSGGFNYSSSNFVNNNSWQARFRTDYALSDKTKVFLSYGIQKGSQYGPSGANYFAGNLGFFNLPGGPTVTQIGSHVLSVNVSSVLTSSLTNEFWAAGGYLSNVTTNPDVASLTGNPYQFFFPNPSTILPSLTNAGYNGLPELGVQDWYYGSNYSKSQVRGAGDDVTKLIGRHTIKAGIFYQWSAVGNYGAQTTNGTFSPANTNATIGTRMACASCANGYTTGPPVYNVGTGNGATTGRNYLASFSEGILSNFTQYNVQVKPYLYYWNLSGYVEDHWRTTSALTLEAGLRIEHYTPWTDPHGVGLAVFDPASYAAGFPAASPGLVYHQINPQIPNAGVPTASAYFDPRGGFAWNTRKNGNTVLRGGVGLYHQHDSFSDISATANTSYGQRSYTSGGDNGGLTFSNLHFYQPDAVGAGSKFGLDSSIQTVDARDNKVPTVLTYNLEIDQALPHGMMFQITYVGNHVYNLLNNQQSGYLANINTIPYGGLWKPMPATRPDAWRGVAQPGYIFPFFTSNPGTASANYSFQNITQAMVDSYRPYPLYNSIRAQKHILMGNYNGLQVRYVVRMGKRANAGVNYTWGKSLGNQWGTDNSNIANNYLPTLLDRRQIFSAYYGYRFGNLTRQRWLGSAINNWRLSGLTMFQTGVYLPAVYGYNYNLNATITVPQGSTATLPTGTSSCASTTCGFTASSQYLLGTPDPILLLQYTGSPRGTKPYQYVNANAIHLPTIGQNGPYSPPDARGPAYFDSDIGISKEFPMENKRMFSVNANATNFLNRANPTFYGTYTAPYTLTYNYTAPSAGDINPILYNAPNSAQSTFGSTVLSNGMPQKTGRRIVNFSIRYIF